MDKRSQILLLFGKNYVLSFTQIEKFTQLRSNVLAYYIERLCKQGLLRKEKTKYLLTQKGETALPLLEARTSLPIILIAPMYKKNVLLIKREHRPYKDYWAMIGGKILFGESLEDACVRHLAAHGIAGKLSAVRAVAHECVREKEAVKHSFIIFFVTASFIGGEGRWFSTSSIAKAKLIPSDRWLLKHKLTAKLDFKQFSLNETRGRVHDFVVE
jgi:ADP-ribose pyrophosphatase YjhB (NUDIX family)